MPGPLLVGTLVGSTIGAIVGGLVFTCIMRFFDRSPDSTVGLVMGAATLALFGCVAMGTGVGFVTAFVLA